MTRLRAMIPARSLVLIAVLGVLAATLWPVPVLTVRTRTPARLLWAGPVRGTVPIRLEYTHSVERTPVVEVYQADRRGLRLVRMEFVSQGAGLPSTGYVREGDRFVLRPDRPLDELIVLVSEVARQRLSIGTQAIDLAARVGGGGLVLLAVRRRPRLAVLLGMLY